MSGTTQRGTGDDGQRVDASDGFAAGMLERMFPAPHQVRRGAGVSGAIRLYALPSASSTRYLVPAEPRRVAAQLVGRQMLGRRVRTRAARAAAVSALRLGLHTSRWPAGFSVVEQPGADSVLSWIRDAVGREDVVLSVALGRPRANRKPVLQVADRTGRALGFAKVGHDELTMALVARETEALQALSGYDLRTVEVPRLLAHDERFGLRLMLMSALETGGDARRDLDRERLVAAVREIAHAAGTEQLIWSRTDHARSLAASLDELGEVGAALRPTLDGLAALDTPVLFGAWHGDLNPGNLAASGERVLVWDWERFEVGVPVGFDLLHHDLQHAVTVRSVEPGRAARTLLAQAPATLAPLGIDAASAHTVVLDYLLTLAVRFSRDRQSEAGAPLGRVQEWLVPALAGAADHADLGVD